MNDRDAYLEDKQAQIDKWISQLARLDASCRNAGDEVRIKFEIQLKEFSENLNDLNAMFREFQELNDYGREKFRQVIEENWLELEDSFKSSIAEYEHLINEQIEK